MSGDMEENSQDVASLDVTSSRDSNQQAVFSDAERQAYIQETMQMMKERTSLLGLPSGKKPSSTSMSQIGLVRSLLHSNQGRAIYSVIGAMGAVITLISFLMSPARWAKVPYFGAVSFPMFGLLYVSVFSVVVVYSSLLISLKRTARHNTAQVEILQAHLAEAYQHSFAVSPLNPKNAVPAVSADPSLQQTAKNANASVSVNTVSVNRGFPS